jgi:hypothetical protein
MSGRVLLISVGLIAVVAAFVLHRRASRHDLKGMAIDAAWEAAKKRGIPEDTELQRRLKAYGDEPSNARRARMAAVDIGKHLGSQVLVVIAWVIALAGLGIAFFGYMWG